MKALSRLLRRWTVSSTRRAPGLWSSGSCGKMTQVRTDPSQISLCSSHTDARDIVGTFYIVDNEGALEGVDVATNATTNASAFTRYTVAPTLFSQTTKITG